MRAKGLNPIIDSRADEVMINRLILYPRNLNDIRNDPTMCDLCQEVNSATHYLVSFAGLYWARRKSNILETVVMKHWTSTDEELAIRILANEAYLNYKNLRKFLKLTNFPFIMN